MTSANFLASRARAPPIPGDSTGGVVAGLNPADAVVLIGFAIRTCLRVSVPSVTLVQRCGLAHVRQAGERSR